MIHRMTALLAVSLMGAVCWAQQGNESADEKSESAPVKHVKTEEAVAILTKADEAAKSVKMVRYNAKYQGLGAAASTMPVIEGSATLAGLFGEDSFKHKTHLKVRMPNSEEVKEYTAGTDGETFYLIDPSTKKVHEDLDSAVIGRQVGRLVQGIWMLEYVHSSPFSDEINGLGAELRGKTNVEGEECHEVHVTYAQAGQEATWFFSTKDYLPRRVDRHLPGSGGEKVTRQLVLSNVMVDPKMTTDPFRRDTPEGYEVTDEFAP